MSDTIIITAIVCMMFVFISIVAAVVKTREPRLKRSECHLDANGNIEWWSNEYE